MNLLIQKNSSIHCSNHKELIIDEKNLLDTVPLMSKLYGKTVNSSQIPTYILSKFAKNDITVALSGDGGDEIFVAIDNDS